MRALIVTNMYPSPAHPALGSFVRDQVEALRRIPEADLELFAFDPGAARAYAAAPRAGVALPRFHPIPGEQARRRLGLDSDREYLLFPADPRRPEKRHDRALELAGDVELLALRDVDPTDVPLWVNAANAVLVTSEREGFGLAVLEALGCDVPVLATDVGIAPEALAGIRGTYCGPFDLAAWRG